MKVNNAINVTWNGADNTNKNAADLSLAGKDVVITVTVFVQQLV